MYYKTDQDSSSSCKGTSGILHINDFCCFKDVTYVSPLHCVINWWSFLHVTNRIIR